MRNLGGKRIAILATDGFEEMELLEPKERLTRAGAAVEVVSPKTGPIRAWRFTNWGGLVAVDRTIGAASVDAYDALILPGGLINPDRLRAIQQAVAFVRAFAESGKPVGAICHGPWLLVEAGILKGRRATSYPSIRTDLENAGAIWVDEPVVVDGNLVTSRRPKDLARFVDRLAELIGDRRT
jgi:protease I